MIRRDSTVLVTAVRVASPLAVVVAVYLFFAGHNRPGGGFAAGLVLGAVISLRIIAGLQRPDRCIGALALGGVIAAAVALAPVVAGEPLLDQVVVETTLPILGKLKTGSAALFDLGVALIVVGTVMAVLDGLGATALAPREEGES